MQSLKLSELMGALSHALDITEGQPEGHCVRCRWIGMHVGQRLGRSNDALWTPHYTLPLKDLGCSSNAARICQLCVGDDLSFKRGALLHDVGKLGVSHSILDKPGKLNDDGWKAPSCFPAEPAPIRFDVGQSMRFWPA